MAVARAKLGSLLWAIALWASALCLSAGSRSVAQAVLPQQVSSAPSNGAPSTGALAGKLTDLRSAPLAGVTVVVRNLATGAEARTMTQKNGSYRFAALDAGEYTIEAESEQFGHGQLEGVEIAAGHEARVQAAMEFEPRPMQTASAPAAPAATDAPAPLRTLIAESRPHEPAVPAPANPTSDARNQPAQQDQIPLDPARLLAPRQLPATVSAAPDTVLAEEPLQSARVTGQPIPAGQPKPSPETAAPVMNARADAEPLPQFPPAAVRAATSSSPLLSSIQVASAAAPTLAMSLGAARGVQAAIKALELSAVAAASKQSEPATSAVTTEVSGEELQALPASGRRWQDFVLDTPASSATAGSSQASLRGAGQDPPDTTIDGASTRLAFGSAAGSEPGSEQDIASSDQVGPEESGAREGWSGGRGVALSEVAIGEVKTEAGNVESEGAHAAGGRIDVETESGGNELHGQGFFFDRQNNWGAQNPFTQWVENSGTAAAPNFASLPYTPPDHETTWGFGVGSRIRRDKLFWFGALDSYRRNDPGLATVKNPSEFFTTYEPTSPEIQVLSAQLNESFNQANNDYLGVPGSGYTAAGLEQLDNLLGPSPRTAAQWVGFARLDWDATERQRFTLEGIGAGWNSPGGGLTRVSEVYGSHSFGSSEASQEWLLARWEAFITPNLLAVTQTSAGREILAARPDAPSALEQGLLSGNAWGQLPQITVDSRYGFTIGNPSRFGQGSYPDERLYHGEEMVDWVRHSVLVKAGIELGHNYDATSLLRNQTGSYSYSKVQNFISDALAFEKFGLNPSNYQNPHNCGVTAGTLGALPCYSYYSQTIGPANWNLSTNDWAGFVTAQWQTTKSVVFSTGMRWELEQLPPPIAALNNTDLPLTEQLPSLGSEWGPRIGVAFGSGKSRWPVVRLGYGMYFGRTENATIETALTQTGSLKGDLSIFERPTDGMNPITSTSAAPLFPNVLTGDPGSVVTPGAEEFAARFRNPEIHQALASIEETLPGHVMVTAAAMASLGRRLPVFIDSNIDLATTGTITYAVVNCPETFSNTVVTCTGAGPIKTQQITVPFYASWPTSTGPAGWLNSNYQAVDQITSKANSTYEAAMIKVTRYAGRGLSLHAHYTYSHAMDWNPGASPMDPNPANFGQEYGTGNLDMRHSAAAMVIYEAPWKLRDFAGKIGNGWMLSGTAQFHTGLPYTMRVAGSLPECIVNAGVTPCTTQYAGLNAAIGDIIVGLRPGMNGSGGDSRVYGVGRNTFRYPQTWKADVRFGKSFKLSDMRQFELLAESFNLFNHQNVTEIETTGYYLESGTATSLPTLNFLNTFTTQPPLTGLAPTSAFGQPLNINATNFYRERQIQFGARFRF